MHTAGESPAPPLINLFFYHPLSTMSIKEKLTGLFPGLYGKYLLERVQRYSHYRRLHRKRFQEIKAKGHADILFVLSNLSMWRFEDLCKLLMKDSRYKVSLVICPFDELAPLQKKEYTEELIRYCERQRWTYLLKGQNGEDLIRRIDPDIIFYPQMYNHLYDNELDCEKNLDRLLVYVPYGLITVSGDWAYNSVFINNSWKFFVPTSIHLDYGRKHSYINGKNMEISGDPHAAAFQAKTWNDPWKQQDHPKKRIIWAPHFSISEGGYLNRACFLWTWKLMKDLAVRYRDQIQFAFKPHPWLLSRLYEHPNWGEEKANAFYDFWRNGDNTQLETGEYVDLFLGSDAMIHDCGSFSAEYHYTGKPVLFVSKNFTNVYAGLDDFGTLCLDLHYQAQTEQEICTFIEHTVLEGNDPRRPEREAFRDRHMFLHAGETFAGNVYSSMTKDLFGE